MRIDHAEFGSITIDGTTYAHDVVIRISGEVLKRKKKLSKFYHGASHKVSKDEAKFLCEEGCSRLIIGTGCYGGVRLSREALSYFERVGCKVVAKPTAEAIRLYNESTGVRAALFHVMG